MTSDEKIAELREWLRMHGDYDVHLDLWSSYGTIRVSVTLLGREVWSDHGTDLGKRLDKARAFLAASVVGVPLPEVPERDG